MIDRLLVIVMVGLLLVITGCAGLRSEPAPQATEPVEVRPPEPEAEKPPEREMIQTLSKPRPVRARPANQPPPVRQEPVVVELEDGLPGLSVKPWLLEMTGRNHYYSTGSLSIQNYTILFSCRLFVGKTQMPLINILDFKIEKAVTDADEVLVSQPFKNRTPFDHQRISDFHELSARSTMPMMHATHLKTLQCTVEIAWGDGPISVAEYPLNPDILGRKLEVEGVADEALLINRRPEGTAGQLELTEGLLAHVREIIFHSATGGRSLRYTLTNQTAIDGVYKFYIPRSTMEGGAIKLHYYPQIRRQKVAIVMKDMLLPSTFMVDDRKVIEVELKPVAR